MAGDPGEGQSGRGIARSASVGTPGAPPAQSDGEATFLDLARRIALTGIGAFLFAAVSGVLAYPVALGAVWLSVWVFPVAWCRCLRALRLRFLLAGRTAELRAPSLPVPAGGHAYRSGAVPGLPALSRRRVIHRAADGGVIELTPPGDRGVAALRVDGRRWLWVFEVTSADGTLHVEAVCLKPGAGALACALPTLLIPVGPADARSVVLVVTSLAVAVLSWIPTADVLDRELGVLVRALAGPR